MGSAIDRYLSEQKPRQNPIDSLISSGSQPGDINLSEPVNPVDAMASAPPTSIVPQQTGVGASIWEAVKEQGRELVQFGKYALTSPPVMGMPAPFSSGLVARDLADAQNGDTEAQKRLDRGLRGGALAASTVISGGASAALKLASGPVAASLTKRALTFATSEALGGATFGAIKPLEDDESRAKAIAEDFALFPIAGAALHGAFKVVGKPFMGVMNRLSQPFVKALQELDAKQAKAVADRAAKIAQEITPEGASPEAVEFAHTQAVAQALEPITEKQFQEELAAITPKPKPPVDEEAAALARVQAARTTPFPNISASPLQEQLIPPRISEPLAESKVRDEAGNLKRVYHGTKKAFDQYDPSVADPEALFGPGIYTTDNPTVAEGYAVDNARLTLRLQRIEELKAAEDMLANFDTIEANGGSVLPIERQSWEGHAQDLRNSINFYTGKLGAPNLRPAYLDIKNPFDIEKFYTKEEYDALAQAANLEDPFVLETGSKIRGEEIYRQTLRELRDKQLVNEALQQAGFDGITHVGGKITGGEAHQVYIAFSPDQIFTPWEIELQRVMAKAAEQPGPVAEAAVADAVAEAAVESTPIVEVMGETSARQTEEVVTSKAITEAAGEPNFLDLYKGDRLAGVAHKALEADSIDPIVEQVAETLQGGVEEIRPTWQQVVADTQPDGGTWNILAKLTREQLNSIENAVKRFGIDQTGAITARTAVRLAAGSAGGWMEMAAQSEDDPRKKSELRTLGGFLALAAVMPGPGMKKLLTETQFTRRIIKWGALDKVMSSGTKEGLEAWQGLMTTGRTMAKLAEMQLRKAFPDKASQSAFMHVLDRGMTAPEWHLLSADQQKEAISHHLLNLNMGKLLQSLGILDHYREDYVRHLLPPASFHAWRGQWESLIKAGNFTLARKFETLTEMEAWAKATGREGPIMDPSVVQAFHLIESYRAIANHQTQTFLEKIGLIQPFDPQAPIPTGWRQIKVANLAKKMAPDDAATMLERAATGAGKFGVFDDAFKALDQVKALWMRTIMLWAWEHGINVLRGGIAIDGTGIAYSKALQAVKRADPAILEAAKYGLDMFQRPDFAGESANAFRKTLVKIGQAVPALGKAGHIVENLHSRGERALWDRWVPAVGFGAYTKYMRDWVSRTGGKYLVGSPEYTTAARAAAKFGNTAMGKVPELLQDPAAQYLMRQALFSPSWLRTRMAITAHAAGDLTKIAAGELNPRDATYLQYKLRSVLLGIGATYALSKIFTGKDPKFNPNSNKFYARTGIRDHKGREQGLDMIGWWQDDVKLFSDPFSFFRDRQNPMIRTGQAALTGRDQFGQEVVGMDRLENILSSFGPASEALQAAGTLAKGHGRESDVLRTASGLLAVGNVASLPKPMDAAISKMATKILRVNGLPQNDDRVWELSRLLRQNMAVSGNLYGGNVSTWIGYQRQTYNRTKTLGPMWNHVRRALRDMARD